MLSTWADSSQSVFLVLFVIFNQGDCGGAGWDGHGCGCGGIFRPGLGTNLLTPGPFPLDFGPFAPVPLLLALCFPGAKN